MRTSRQRGGRPWLSVMSGGVRLGSDLACAAGAGDPEIANQQVLAAAEAYVVHDNGAVFLDWQSLQAELRAALLASEPAPGAVEQGLSS